MPKLKTHKGAASRFHITGSGKLLRMKGGSSHLRRKKASRAKRLYDEKVPVHAADVPRLRRLMPYG
ncbi:MAG TPA: 50S ribosomal protein L35 [Dehalococcoidia bacterium]|nr:50S ribosomal protein L35 [Dehalococcoidia bacterium]